MVQLQIDLHIPVLIAVRSLIINIAFPIPFHMAKSCCVVEYFRNFCLSITILVDSDFLTQYILWRESLARCARNTIIIILIMCSESISYKRVKWKSSFLRPVLGLAYYHLDTYTHVNETKLWVGLWSITQKYRTTACPCSRNFAHHVTPQQNTLTRNP